MLESSKYLEKAEELLGKVRKCFHCPSISWWSGHDLHFWGWLQFNEIDLDSPGIQILKDSFCAVHEIVKTVANIAVPPPGGQIISAALTITFMVIKGAMNVKACRELAFRCNRLFVQVLRALE